MGTENPFSPAAITAALAAGSLTVPDGHRGMFLTSFDGQTITAKIAMKIGDHWTIVGDAAWHGGTPQIGIQAQATW